MAEKSRTRDWTLLPSDLLQRIADRLPDISDRIRFRAVSVQWRSITILKSHPQQLPWLLLPASYSNNPNNAYNRQGNVRFMNLSNTRILEFPLPVELRNCKIFGSSSRGWLIAASTSTSRSGHHRQVEKDVYSITLVNPITRSTIPLPPLSLPSKKLAGYHVEILDLGTRLVVLFTLCKKAPQRSFYFCSPGEPKWRRFSTRVCTKNLVPAVHNGRLVLFSRRTYKTEIRDMTSVKLVSEIAGLDSELRCGWHSFSLTELPSGELVLILQHWYGKKFKVFQLDESEEHNLKWEEVHDIRDCFLFVTGGRAICTSSNDFKGYRGNCIFCHRLGKGMSVFDLESGSSTQAQLFPDFGETDWRSLQSQEFFIPGLSYAE